MIFDQNGNTSIITQEKVSVIELVKKLQALYPKFKNHNIIVSLTSLDALTQAEIVEFLELSNTHKVVSDPTFSGSLILNKEVLEEYPSYENYCMDILVSHL